jgi:peroxidase
MELHMKNTWWKSLGARKSKRAKSANRPRTVKPAVEQLEQRCLLDARTITGFGNNIVHPTWGESGTDLLRVSPVAYADGISSPSTPNTLGPREISNNLSNQSNPIFSFADNLGGPNAQRLSDYSYAWGQFIDHDMDLSKDNSGQAFDIPEDPTRQSGPKATRDPMGVEPFTRSQFDPTTGTSTSNPRQQVNAVTSYMDLSQVYGSTDFIADALRTHSGGHLKTSPGNLLPYNNLSYFTQGQLDALNMANDAQQVPSANLFAAGDRRANENIELTSLQTLFMRNHNRLANQLHDLHPSWTDDQLYQEARKLNIAEMEIINYTGYLPSILGANALPAFTGYNPNVNAGIATEFSTVGFRFGHSLLSNTVGRDNDNGTGITDVNPNGSTINLTEDFFRPDLINPNGLTVNLVDRFGNPDPHTSSDIGAVVKALADGEPNETDLLLIDEIRNILFGIPNGPGTDLAARDIQRARDHGIGTYNQVRVAYGLPAVTSFSQISSNPAVRSALQSTYGTVNAIDPFEGMLAEDHLAGADVGPLVEAILVKQFTTLRDGDRFFYLNESFNTEEMTLIAQGNTLAKVIENNTNITNLQADVFFFKVSISGTVFFDADRDGVRVPTDPGVQGVIINLLDAGGHVIATTTTDANGHYSFTDQTGIPGSGDFTVSIVVPNGKSPTTPIILPVHISRGGLDFENEDFGIAMTI